MKTPINFLASKTLRPIMLVLVLALLHACGNPKKQDNTGKETTEQEQPEVQTFKLAIETHSAREENCKGAECTHIRLRIPQLEGGDTTVAQKVNSFIKDEIREVVKSRLPEPQGNIPLDVMCESFIEGYKLFLMEFPDSDQKWYLEINGDSSMVEPDYFTSFIRHREYLGGAHPAAFIQLHSFDLATGNLIQLDDRFDMDRVKQEAEKRFRKQNDLSADADLNDAGYLFKDGVFSLPENMALTPDGLLLIYNSYEVASYSEGPTRILIPYAAILPSV